MLPRRCIFATVSRSRRERNRGEETCGGRNGTSAGFFSAKTLRRDELHARELLQESDNVSDTPRGQRRLKTPLVNTVIRVATVWQREFHQIRRRARAIASLLALQTARRVWVRDEL